MEGIILPVFLFALVMTITPGPNNMLLTASGARFGYRRTLPMIMGITVGILSQLCLSALGLGVLFEKVPLLKVILKFSGSAYILYLAFKITFPHKKGASEIKEEERKRPQGFLQGAAFQYMNPKAYLMTITAMSIYPEQTGEYGKGALIVLIIFALIAPLSISLWAGFGALLNRFSRGGKETGINYLLGALTAGSVIFILI